MTLETLNYNQPIDNLKSIKKRASTPSLARQRIISESTGLVKFQITRKKFETEQLNKEFSELESSVQTTISPSVRQLKTIRKAKSGLNLPSSTISSSSSPSLSPAVTKNFKSSTNLSNESIQEEEQNELFIKLASKQRQVLEYKTQLNKIKQSLQKSERELNELQHKCNSIPVQPSSPKSKTLVPISLPSPSTFQQQLHNHNNSQRFDQQQNPFTLIRSKPSIQQLKSSFDSSQQNFNNFITKQRNSIKEEFNSNSNIFNKSLNFMNTLIENKNLNTNEDEYESDSDISDYGSADTSDFTLAVK